MTGLTEYRNSRVSGVIGPLEVSGERHGVMDQVPVVFKWVGRLR